MDRCSADGDVIIPIDLLRKMARNKWFGNPVQEAATQG
jgi:hypothetical protein